MKRVLHDVGDRASARAKARGSLSNRAESTVHDLDATIRVVEDISFAGGGSLPTQQLKTFAVRWQPAKISAESAVRALRRADPPIIARIHKGALLFDCRTIRDEDVEAVAEAVTLLSP
ncbi:MAG: hypothetical protein IIB58_04500 [Planctomycetes bacterium]|nr:hypothetical protein [Planctomycetota bacterium]